MTITNNYLFMNERRKAVERERERESERENCLMI
jgi:hypothetical protein